MTASGTDHLLASHASEDAARGADDAALVAASNAAPVDKAKTSADQEDAKLAELLKRLPTKASPAPAATSDLDAAHIANSGKGNEENQFVPKEPASFLEAQLTATEVEAILLKLLLSRGDASGRQITDHVKLPFLLLTELLHQMKQEQMIVHRGSAPMNDYVYQLTDLGRERARRLAQFCSYFGAAPISLKDYIASVHAQSLTTQHPTADNLREAFADLLVNQKMFARLGPAINSGRGLFLYGAPGNGKSSIAERVTRAFGQFIWIPRALGIDGEIIRVYDPTVHEEAPAEQAGGLLDENRIDRRWIRVRRPTVVVGGELTMENLEVMLNTSTGISEAPVQLKSNCGTLVIDDFGRQRISTDALLNRWIVPLEKRHDYLNLANGKKIQVPFDQLVIFSTNLEPRELVDDAFLRRIPYKIQVIDPTEEEFVDLFRMMAPKFDFEYNDDAVQYLLETHYRAVGRPLRCCQPRDLLLQIRNYCHYNGASPTLTREAMDFAVENYFAVM